MWSVVCFFIDGRLRGRGIAMALRLAAVDYSKSNGVRVVEGYPVEPGPRLYTYMGAPPNW